MADFPNIVIDHVPVGHLSTLGQGSEAGETYSSSSLSLPAAVAWGTALYAIYIPITIPVPFTVYKMAVLNGATVAGNVDVGIYDRWGNRLVSMGSTAMAGVSTVQSFDVADTVLTPANYFFAFVSDSTTATFSCVTLAAQGQRASGVQVQTLGAMPLPATATFATPTNTIVPWVSASIAGTVI